MKKVKNKPETKTKLLDAAIDLMSIKGFVATTVDEICTAAELTKGSFFHYFNSKEDLGIEVLDRFSETMILEMRESPFHRTDDPLKAALGFTDFLIDINKKFIKKHGRVKSCLVANFAQVVSETHPAFREACDKHFNFWIETIKGNLDEAKVKYIPNKDIDTRDLAIYMLATYEGALTIAKAKHDVGVIEKSLQLCKQNIADIFETGNLQTFYNGL